MGVRILKGGMLTTVQDLGRTGYQSQGFSVSGVMDVRSFKIANLLLDNPENEAVLEFTLMGPTLEFTSETIISITGGDFRPQINGKPAKMYTAIYMHRGDILTFGGARTGTRGYIAFSSSAASSKLRNFLPISRQPRPNFSLFSSVSGGRVTLHSSRDAYFCVEAEKMERRQEKMTVG